jgi:hypothetical protein
MGVQQNGSTMKPKRLRRRSILLCAITGLSVLAITARVQEPRTFAQTSPLPSTSTGQLGISPEEPVAPPQPIIVRVPAQPSADQPAKVEMPAIPEPDPKNPVAVQSANLLKMAYNLKTEVDKTTKDTLSVSVVRQAAEIEQIARKMRTK